MASTESSSSKTAENGRSDPSRDDLDAQIKQLRADISALTDTVQRMGTGKVRKFQSRANKAGDEAFHAYNDAVDGLKKEVDTLESDLEDQIRSNPLQSIGIAAGLGFLAALMMRR